MPIQAPPWLLICWTTARMTAFSPGQSPPPVSNPTFMGSIQFREHRTRSTRKRSQLRASCLDQAHRTSHNCALETTTVRHVKRRSPWGRRNSQFSSKVSVIKRKSRLRLNAIESPRSRSCGDKRRISLENCATDFGQRLELATCLPTLAESCRCNSATAPLHTKLEGTEPNSASATAEL